jgi:hypothetical protein
MASLIDNRYVDGLEAKVKLLENQLTAIKSAKNSQSQTLQGRRLSDQDRDHSAAAALSSLGRVSTPASNPFADAPAQHPYHTPDDTISTPLPIIAPSTGDANENETYEWDEGGDEKELGTDAMGAASTRDYKPGFFGIVVPRFNDLS